MNIAGDNERLIRSSFGANYYNELCEYFHNIWKSNAAYKVFMARRAFNLNYAFMGIMNAQYKDEYETESIMSNTALLLCAEEIADYYRATNEFPSILIADDLLLHGRGMVKLIDSLERLVVDFLREKTKQSNLREEIHNKLLAALNIYVFAQNINTNSIVLDRKLALKAAAQLPPSELRALSQQISRALQQCSVANTSYVLSAELPWSFCKKEYSNDNIIDGSSLFQYRGNILRYYYRNTNDKILETVRVYFSDKGEILKHMATSLVIFGEIPYSSDDRNNDFSVLCRYVSDKVKQIIPYSRIADILDYEHKCLVRPRAQMLSFLFSILSYYDFYREKISTDPYTINKALLQSDYEKIAANFDKPKKIRSEIIKLFNHISYNDNFKLRLFDALQNFAGKFSPEQDTIDKAQNYKAGTWKQENSFKAYLDSQEIHETAEDIFYEIGMNAECDANEYSQTHAKFDPSTPASDSISFKQYLKIMRWDGVDAVPSIGCILGLMDSGLLAMNLELNHTYERIQCILKAGELSTFVLPRRFSVLIPALSIVERGHWKKGLTKESIVSRFIDYLQDHCYQRDKKDNVEDVDLLRKLKCSKASLLFMYIAGQSFQDWDVNLLTEEDRRSHGLDERGNFSVDKYIFWASEEEKRERFYSYCARVFLHSDNI